MNKLLLACENNAEESPPIIASDICLVEGAPALSLYGFQGLLSPRWLARCHQHNTLGIWLREVCHILHRLFYPAFFRVLKQNIILMQTDAWTKWQSWAPSCANPRVIQTRLCSMLGSGFHVVVQRENVWCDVDDVSMLGQIKLNNDALLGCRLWRCSYQLTCYIQPLTEQTDDICRKKTFREECYQNVRAWVDFLAPISIEYKLRAHGCVLSHHSAQLGEYLCLS